MLKTLNVSEENYSALTDIGKKGETYNDIVGKLINRYMEQKVDELTEELIKKHNEVTKRMLERANELEEGAKNHLENLNKVLEEEWKWIQR